MKRLTCCLLLIGLLIGCSKEPAPRPVADFTYSVISSSNVEKIYQFTNTSKNADRFQWLTPSGLASSDKNINVSVTQNGRINVSLTAKNDVGEDTKVQSIDVTGLATTGDVIFWSQIGNYGDISINVNGVYQGKLTKYMTSNSAPSCGLQGFVTVTLNPGTYSYTAKSEGIFPLSWSGTFTVVRGECRTFQLIK